MLSHVEPGTSFCCARSNRSSRPRCFPEGYRYLILRDNLDAIFRDRMSSSIRQTQGRSAEARWRLALVTIVRCAENLSDREAADAVRQGR